MQNLAALGNLDLNSPAGNLRGGQQLTGDSAQEINKKYV
jgi:hypothetical protein